MVGVVTINHPGGAVTRSVLLHRGRHILSHFIVGESRDQVERAIADLAYRYPVFQRGKPRAVDGKWRSYSKSIGLTEAAHADAG